MAAITPVTGETSLILNLSGTFPYHVPPVLQTSSDLFPNLTILICFLQCFTTALCSLLLPCFLFTVITAAYTPVLILV